MERVAFARGDARLHDGEQAAAFGVQHVFPLGEGVEQQVRFRKDGVQISAEFRIVNDAGQIMINQGVQGVADLMRHREIDRDDSSHRQQDEQIHQVQLGDNA